MKPNPWLLALSLGVGLLGCDKQDADSGLPDATGEAAPERVDMPTPAKAAAGEGAYETASHRWVGSVRAKHHVELAPGMTGVIANIAVEEGDTVEAGQQVFRIEGSSVKLAVSQAQAGVAAAELQLAEAERETERTRKLAERGSVGSANLERAEAQVAAAKAGVKQARAATALARSHTADLTVESPISGVVTHKYKNVGEVATMMPPTIVLVIDDLSTIEVRVRVPELKLRELDVGSPVTVSFPALDRTLEVPITRIGNAVDPQTRTIELIIDVDNPDLRIKSGMSVEVELDRPPEPNAAEAEAEPEAKAEAEADAEAEPDSDPVSPTAMIAPKPTPG
ncbi:Multidrug resistance protein MdtA precursor [Enhygromyxa salina]|uniref:Multidrug resistance protein MdtA n=1 Tax=Enhygromyxa salina TaxID=215803 RepID=A0A2S9XDW8_9BACT|nr:efflux RND transporter periplasmic adaptor subunit [Enhygromyxa salina]PRP91052.1 Multidrug resistance protein MdtA precursor [Enhygromyxa salina]